ncbi:YihY/virulence factor BrkB family protein [Caballeronia glathei]|uniref:Ribonuclease BN n=1 Tax=Caballeronia glathei TaxID=60547 RepID=A0A069PD80_9BURK|nr:YihY/virulence factor BrkB family protein [Caballeronia glathei]KDR37759.1 ribonuclease BN [Caballeronia glathei]
MNTLSPKYLQSVAKKDASWVINALKKFSDDRCAAMAASIAFYSAFSLAPTLVMVIAVAGWVFGPEAARGQLFHQVNGMLGDQAAAGVQSIVTNAHRSGESGMAAIVSFVLLVIGASATFSSLNTALNLIWPASGEPKSSVVALVKLRLISLGLVLGVAFLLIVSLVLDTAVQAAGKWLWGTSPLVVVGDIVQFVLGLAILSAAFGALLKFLPDGHVFWRDALVGGLIAAVLFSAGKKLFALYLTHAGTASAFGAAGSLAVLLMWLYFAAAVLLLGAESSAARARKGDPQPRKAPDAITAPTVRGSNDVVPLDPSGATVRVSRPRADSNSLQLRAVRMFSRPLISAESHATRSAARALIGASRKFSQTNQLVHRYPWRATLLAATTGLVVAVAAGRTHGRDH